MGLPFSGVGASCHGGSGGGGWGQGWIAVLKEAWQNSQAATHGRSGPTRGGQAAFCAAQEGRDANSRVRAGGSVLIFNYCARTKWSSAGLPPLWGVFDFASHDLLNI